MKNQFDEFNFKNEEDLIFFSRLLNINKEQIHKYKKLFDFRNPTTKRKEFSRTRDRKLNLLIKRYGETCELQYEGICSLSSGLNVDHIIPLSTNKLNKELRDIKPKKGKKVESQSLGSNNIQNLAITCARCNAYKKHKILNQEKLTEILNRRSDLL